MRWHKFTLLEDETAPVCVDLDRIVCFLEETGYQGRKYTVLHLDSAGTRRVNVCESMDEIMRLLG